jgi:hypothetical protein
MRNAVRIYTDGLEWDGRRTAYHRAAAQDMGFPGSPGGVVGWVIANGTTEQFLDFLEISFEWRPNKRQSAFCRSINNLAERHRFGYRLEEDGTARMIDSPALSEMVIGPALLAVRRPGWEAAEQSFKEALHHQRGGVAENDDALTAANSALEAALKAAGMKGDRLSALAKDLRGKLDIPPELEGVPDALDTLLKRSGAIRDNHGDAHGRDAGKGEVPQALVNLTIQLTGAFIVFLAEETK